ncbi:MAG: hypothetical protein JSV60_09005, partial [Desulfobacterales bacterium]
ALKGGGSALRQHCVSGERAGQPSRNPIWPCGVGKGRDGKGGSDRDTFQNLLWERPGYVIKRYLFQGVK